MFRRLLVSTLVASLSLAPAMADGGGQSIVRSNGDVQIQLPSGSWSTIGNVSSVNAFTPASTSREATPAGAIDPCANAAGAPSALYSTGQVTTTYRGPLYLARRETDNATMMVSSPASNYTSSAIKAWAGSSEVLVSTIYDQSGNGADLVVATAFQPHLNLDATYPTFEFDGASARIDATSALASLTQNVGGFSLVALRKNDATSTAFNQRPLALVTTGSGATRVAVGIDNAVGVDGVSGRRLDGDTLNRSGGFTIDNNWDVETARFDFANALVYHNTSVAGETRAFETAGSTSNTASQFFYIAGTATTGYFEGKIAVLALYQSALSESSNSCLMSALSAQIPSFSTAAPPLDFLAGNLTGTYTLATGLTNYTVTAPDGTTPAYTDINSFRYHHHTRTAIFNGYLFVAFSGGASAEEQGGQVSEVMWSPTSSVAFSGTPTIAVPPQTLPFQLTGSGDQIGTRISYPTGFVTYNSTLYLISAIDQVNAVGSASSYQQGMALAATPITVSGSTVTPGTTFLVSPIAYPAAPGVTGISYDATNGPPIFALILQNGTWGSSAPGQPSTPWNWWSSQDMANFNEPNTVALNSTGSSLLRIWRKNNGSWVTWLWYATSADYGRTWTKLKRTNIPSSGTETTAIRLTNGQLVIVGNPQYTGTGTVRDPLYVASFGSTSGQLCGVLAVRQGLSNTPTYPNGANGGAQYPSVASDGTNLYISYSITKQNVGLTTIPLTSLASCT